MEKKKVFIIVFLVSAYVICQAIADIGATAFVEIAGLTFPAGTFVFALTFTLRDMLHKRLGKDWARAAIISAGALNIFQAFYLAGVAKLPHPAYFALGDAWSAIFAVVPAIAIGSITAEVVSELIDTEIYHYWKTKFKFPQWTAVLVSNVVSLPIDSLIFAFLAFVFLPPLFGGESMPFTVALGLMTGQIVFKAIVTLISMPAIYLVKDEKVI